MQTRWPFTTRGTALVCVGAVMLGASPLMGVVAVAMAGALFVALPLLSLVVLFFAGRVTHLTRALSSDVVVIGEWSTVTVRFRARSTLLYRDGQWYDTLSSGLQGVTGGWLASGTRTGSHHQIAVTYTVTGTRRGPAQLGPFRLTLTDALGLVRIHRGGRSVLPVVIAPAIVPLAPLRGSSPDAHGRSERALTRGQGSDDNLIPRAYERGDSMRRIHWRATAHHGDLMVRQEERSTHPRASVFLVRSDILTLDESAFDTAASAYLSICSLLVTAGYTVAIHTSSGNDELESMADVSSLQHDLADVARSGLNSFGTLESRQLHPDDSGVVIVVTDTLTRTEAATIPVSADTTRAILLAIDAADVSRADLPAGWDYVPPSAHFADTWAELQLRGVRDL